MIFANLIFQTTNTSYGKVQPEKGFTFTSRDLVMIPFSIFWLAFALFWEFSVITSTSSLFMAIWGLPFVGVGIYLLFGRWIRKRKKQIFK